MANRSTLVIAAAALIGGVVLLMLGGSNPVVLTGDAKTAHDAIQAYAHGLADAFEAIADDDLTDVQANKQLGNLETQTRRKAMLPIDQALQSAVGESGWDQAKADKIMRNIARGLRAVK